MISFPSGYMVSPIIAAVGTLFLIVLVIQAGFKDRSVKLFLMVLISLELWSVFTFVMRSAHSTENAVFWARIFSIAGLGLFLTFFHFCHVYIGHRARWPIVLIYGLFAPAAVLILGTKLVIEKMAVFWFGYAPVVGPIGILLFGASQALIFGAVLQIARRGNRDPKPTASPLALRRPKNRSQGDAENGCVREPGVMFVEPVRDHAVHRGILPPSVGRNRDPVSLRPGKP